MLWKILNRFTAFGTSPMQSSSLNRQITLCNTIALLVMMQSLIFGVANVARGDISKTSVSFFNMSMQAFILLLNRRQYHVLARVLISCIVPTSVLAANISANILQPTPVFVTPYFGTRVIILAASLCPMLLFSIKREAWLFWSTYLYCLFLLVSFDGIQWLLGTSIHRAALGEHLKGYYFANITFALCATIISGMIAFLRYQNHQFESQLLMANEELASQKEEILTQNEELQEQQHEIRAQRDYIEEQHNQTKNSIRTAHTIQSAILPTPLALADILQHYFVLYMPRDVVSGDFYWVNKVNNHYVLVVADCTGHGVPGAFMTLIAHTLLDKIVHIWQITDPATVLERLHQDVKNILHQDITKNNMGMDAMVLVWEWEEAGKATLYFEGAKTDLRYILPAERQIVLVKGTRRGLGGEQNESRQFVTQKFVLPTHTKLYAGSDGLFDQNDEARRRLGAQPVEDLHLEKVNLPMEEQKNALNVMLEAFMRGTTQRDDILWIGFELLPA